MKKETWKAYARWILLAEAVGAFAGAVIRDGVKYYEAYVVKPPLTPPGPVFPWVWGILYALMGIGAARVDLAAASRARTVGLRLWWVQLGFNFFWSIIFFLSRSYAAAFLWLTALWALIVWMTLTFREVDLLASRLQYPYLCWVFYAGYLNFGVWMLNR